MPAIDGIPGLNDLMDDDLLASADAVGGRGRSGGSISCRVDQDTQRSIDLLLQEFKKLPDVSVPKTPSDILRNAVIRYVRDALKAMTHRDSDNIKLLRSLVFEREMRRAAESRELRARYNDATFEQLRDSVTKLTGRKKFKDAAETILAFLDQLKGYAKSDREQALELLSSLKSDGGFLGAMAMLEMNGFPIKLPDDDKL